MLKAIKLVSLTLLASSVLLACGSKKDDAKKEEGKTEETTEETESDGGTVLEGTWVINRATGEMSSMNVGIIYEFNGNKLTFGSESYKNPGTTEVTETTFSFQADGNDLKFMYDYKMEGDTLVVMMQGSDQTFYMVKNK